MARRIRELDWSATPLGPISGWPQSLKTIVDLMLRSTSMMSLVWGAEATHFYNDSFTELLREHHVVALGRSAFETFARSRDVFASDVAAGMAGHSARLIGQRYPVLRNGCLEDAWFDVEYAPVFDEAGRPVAVLWTLKETTAQYLADRALRESEERFRGLVEGFGQFSWEASADGLIEADSPGWRAFTGQSVDEWLGWGWIAAIHPDDRAGTEAKWRQALATRTAVDHEYRLWHAPSASWRWSNVRAVPITKPDGSIRKWSGMNIDVTDRHKLLARQEVLVNELQHRARNLLAVVMSIADRTVRRGGSVEAFEVRLQALSRAQGLLSQGGTDGVEVGALVRAELAAHADGGSGRATVWGPEVFLTARQVQNFALALHELATNAVKYGALHQETGRLFVTWELLCEPREQRRLALSWVETGVIIKPGQVRRHGYGTELIQDALSYALEAKVDYELGVEGVRCRIEMPVT